MKSFEYQNKLCIGFILTADCTLFCCIDQRSPPPPLFRSYRCLLISRFSLLCLWSFINYSNLLPLQQHDLWSLCHPPSLAHLVPGGRYQEHRQHDARLMLKLLRDLLLPRYKVIHRFTVCLAVFQQHQSNTSAQFCFRDSEAGSWYVQVSLCSRCYPNFGLHSPNFFFSESKLKFDHTHETDWYYALWLTLPEDIFISDVHSE